MSARAKKRATIKDLEARVRALEAQVFGLVQESWMHKPIGPGPNNYGRDDDRRTNKIVDELTREAQKLGLYDVVKNIEKGKK